MEVLPLDVRQYPEAYRLYLRLTEGLAHCFPPTFEEFHHGLSAAPVHARAMGPSAVFDQGALRAFGASFLNRAHGYRLAGGGAGSLVYLFADQREPGAALIRAMTQDLSQHGASRIIAFDPGEGENNLAFFNSGFSACPEGLPHVVQVLAMEGFRVAARELHLSASLEELSGGSKPEIADVEYKWEVNDPPRLHLRAFRSGRWVASCKGHLLSARQSAPAARSVGYVEWLGVEPEYQGRGIGRGILARVLDRLAQLGAERFSLTTGSQNWRAQPLYLSMGFQVTGTSVSLSLDCKNGP